MCPESVALLPNPSTHSTTLFICADLAPSLFSGLIFALLKVSIGELVMITKPYLAFLLLLSWLWLSGEIAAAPVRKIAPEQALPEVDNLQQLLSSGTDAQPEDATEVDQLQPYGVAPDARIKSEK